MIHGTDDHPAAITAIIPAIRPTRADTSDLAEWSAITHDARYNAGWPDPWDTAEVAEWSRELRRRNQERAEEHARTNAVPEAIRAKYRTRPRIGTRRHARYVDRARRFGGLINPQDIPLTGDTYAHRLHTAHARVTREQAAS